MCTLFFLQNLVLNDITFSGMCFEWFGLELVFETFALRYRQCEVCETSNHQYVMYDPWFGNEWNVCVLCLGCFDYDWSTEDRSNLTLQALAYSGSRMLNYQVFSHGNLHKAGFSRDHKLEISLIMDSWCSECMYLWKVSRCLCLGFSATPPPDRSCLTGRNMNQD